MKYRTSTLLSVIGLVLFTVFSSYAQENPTNLTNVNGTLFFSATTADYGTELWKSDGSLAGTQLVKDIAPATASSSPANLFRAGTSLYFTINSGTQLWKSDGTAQGTDRCE
jgi:ELWxxDGT repeat protein